jgi:hypothetical protein
MALNT